MEHLQYPVGKFQFKDEYTSAELKGFIHDFTVLPGEMKKITDGMSPEHLQRSYRNGGWTAAQVVHHVADSHMNFYIRAKLALTEDTPIIKPYSQDKWAEAPDSKSHEIEASMDVIKGIHKKIVMLLKDLSAEEWERKFYHPDSKRHIKIKQVAALYSWHFKHHLEHLKMCAGK